MSEEYSVQPGVVGQVDPDEFDNYDLEPSDLVEVTEMDEVQNLKEYPEGDDEDGS